MRRVRPVLLAAVLVLPLAAQPGSAVPTSATEPVHPVFENGEAQPVFDASRAVHEEVWVGADVDSDGDGHDDKVHVEVVRPKESTEGLEVPVVFQASPYFSGGNDVPNHGVDHELYVPEGQTARQASGDERLAVAGQRAARSRWQYERYFLERGYAVVYGESLGTGLSTGCPTTGAENETLGAKSVVDWLNGRAFAADQQGRPVEAKWSTGKVGMMGVSYNGTLLNAVAGTGVEGLEAIVPIAAISNWYDYYRTDGAVVAPGDFQGEDADVLAKYVYTRQDREVCKPVIDGISRHQDRVTGDYSPFWDERNYLDDARDVRAATLVVHGLNDWNVKTRQAAQWYEALKAHHVPHKIWWHQQGHQDPLGIGGQQWQRTLNRWFTRYLYDHENGVEHEPRSTIQREDGRFVEEADWPAPHAEDVTLHPSPGGAERGGLGDKPGSGVETFSDDATKPVRELAAAGASPHRLTYLTAPVAEPSRMSGTVVADLALSVDSPAANVTAALVDVAPDGSTSVVTRGWTDPQNRDSLGETTPIEPGTTYPVQVEMQPDDYVLQAEHRWGVVVLSSDHEHTIRPKSGTGLALDLAASRFHLPLVG
ncbi:Xaa-Pro dipeptidyl-peptidase [Allosaccharopolyspora coralli]|uniref:Xaa-Pro dipeptidyl-peptidase n=1 Tax=Allosaccharopolyspora coralli TaxID=2665642 RepID=A0A5Q3Q6I6_9PSEU|nr:Xaa-Pro dipeptidyl-peptidase [Allosaccharopolyspora coralli]QGK69460.1 Xaa-Pro dipeptidyl-peptidase [Allosaccharopolyspora coralli]